MKYLSLLALLCGCQPDFKPGQCVTPDAPQEAWETEPQLIMRIKSKGSESYEYQFWQGERGGWGSESHSMNFWLAKYNKEVECPK